MWTTHSAEPAVHPIKRNGSAHVPAGTSQRARGPNAMPRLSRCGAGGPIEELTGLQHRVHRHGQFAGYGNSSSFEADPLAEFEAPCPQGAVGRAAGQDHRGGFVEKPSQMTIAAPGYVAIIIDLS